MDQYRVPRSVLHSLFWFGKSAARRVGRNRSSDRESKKQLGEHFAVLPMALQWAEFERTQSEGHRLLLEIFAKHGLLHPIVLQCGRLSFVHRPTGWKQNHRQQYIRRRNLLRLHGNFNRWELLLYTRENRSSSEIRWAWHCRDVIYLTLFVYIVFQINLLFNFKALRWVCWVWWLYWPLVTSCGWNTTNGLPSRKKQDWPWNPCTVSLC